MPRSYAWSLRSDTVSASSNQKYCTLTYSPAPKLTGTQLSRGRQRTCRYILFFHSSPFFSIFYTLSWETASTQLLWNQSVAHSFHNDVGVHTCVHTALCRMATPRVCPDLFGEQHDDQGFLIHESRVTVISSCYISGHNVTGHSATKDYKRCSMHGTTFLPGTTSRAIFKR